MRLGWIRLSHAGNSFQRKRLYKFCHGTLRARDGEVRLSPSLSCGGSQLRVSRRHSSAEIFRVVVR